MLLFTPNNFLLFIRLSLCRLLSGCFLVFFVFMIHPTSVFAEGSKELIANGGDRATLSSTTVSSQGNYFPTEGLVRVYVNAGETIYLGSSDSHIILISPTGKFYETDDNNIGRIRSVTEESTGPRYNHDGNYGTGTYYAYTHTTAVGETGIWSVFFLGNNDFFDVSVSASPTATSSADFIKGRAYMNVFSGSMGDFDKKFKGIFYVLTNDGYTYKVDANELAGNTFTFFSNNKGYQNADGTPSYESEDNVSTTDLHDPRLPDNAGTVNVTHKLFFNVPDVPVNTAVPIWLLNDFTDGIDDNGTNGNNATGGTLSTTWLQITPMLPVINNFTFTGNEGTSNQAGTIPLGGVIRFDSNQGGTYTITIDVPGPNNVTLTGNAVAGTNSILWDGKDGAGNRVQGTIGTSAITVGLKAGEVHFPYIDVENNRLGIKITRLGAGVGNTTVYWDDSPITGGTSDLDGADSGSGAHTWGSGTYDSNDFGNEKGLDTWAYLLSSALSPTLPISLREADLEVVSLTSNKATYCVGETITYTLTIRNNGPDAVTGAKVAFSFPSELTITGITAPATAGITFTAGTNNGPTFTDVPITATLSMADDAVLVVTITASIDSKPTGALDAKVSIMRPADVTDPDATNPDNAVPTDPDAECNSGTVGCNNIKTHSAAVQVSDISIVATSASKSEGNTAGSLTDMTFTVSLSAANNGCSVTVDYNINHNLTNASDFNFTAPYPASGTLTFAPGETSKVLTFKVRQDLMVEGNETFSVVLSNPSSGGQITTASDAGTINNDDAISQVGITKVDGAEGGANGSFTFTFPGGASFDVDTPVPYALSGTATGSGTDYTAAGTAGTITIPAGSSSVTLNLTVNNDALMESSETVIITPGTVGNTYNASVTVITPVPVVTIADNDPATLTISSPSITEGDSGTQNLTFNVTLSNATGSSVSVNYATANGTALAGEDYVTKSGTLTFAGTAETQTISIQVNGDQKIEQNEAFTITLSGLTNTFGGQLTIAGSPATGTITDNDNTLANRVITIIPTNGQELGPVSGVFTFSFPAGVSADQPTTVNFGLTGVAGAADYTGAVTSVIIPAGANSETVSLTVLGDDILEGPESVILTATTVINSSYTITVDNSPHTLNIIDDDFANIITGNVSVPEGNNGLTDMVFNVQLDKATGSGFTIGYTITNGTAIAGEDYIAQTGTLTFSGAAETQQITVKVNGDQKIEANETLILTLGTPSNTFGGFLSVNFSPATGTITDDDNTVANKTITITKANGYEFVGPDASFTFSFPNGVTVDSDTEISYTLTGTATGGAVDYTGSASGTIRIFAGQNSATLNLPVVDDVMLEGDETVIVTVNGTSNPAYDPFTVSNSGLSLDIIENDNTVLLSSPATVVEGNTGTKTIEFKVTVALATSLPFTVDFHTTNGTALAVEDYVAQSGTMSFAANTPNQVKSIFVTINGDLKIENNETFTVTLDGLSNNFGNTLSLSPPVTMDITDDDNIPANKIISISKTDGAEPGIDGTFTLSLPTGITVDAATTINYILSGTAQAGGIDYTDTELTSITIPAGQNSVTLSMVDVADDYIIEGTESVIMTITSVTNTSYAGFAGNAPVALDITDDDNTAANNVITLSKMSDGSEPGTKAQFRVSFPTTPNLITASVPATVNYTISGTAVSGADYAALTGTVIIPAGSSSALIDVLVINDGVIEPTETVSLTLTGASNSISTLTVSPGLVSADIADDDNIPSNNIITLSKVSDGSEPGTDAQFKVSFPTGITSSVNTTVSYTVSPTGTASAGTDYTALSGTVIIPAGGNSALIDVEVIDDQIIEKAETVLLTLTSATNSISTLTVQPVNLVGVTIADDDNTAGNNIISISSITDASEPAANGLFRLSYPTGISSSEATQVTYAVSGTAVNGTDYTTLPLTVVIPAYANSVDINIAVVNDQIIEPTETVGLTLTLADNLSFNPTVNGTLADIDINDDDNGPANNRIILNAVTGGSEPGTPGQFTVGFPAGYTSSEQTIVNYLIGGTATSGADYTALTGTVIIPANSGPVPINVAVLNDNIIEGTEMVAITLDNATNSIIASLATLPGSAVNINIDDDEDDDPADNIITLTRTNGSEPGSNATFIVSYPAGITSSKNTQIGYTVGAGGTATSGTDYTALSGTATILAGNTFATIQVPVIDDSIIELTETVELTINSANNSISTLTWSPLVAVSANIADNDNNLANNTISLSKETDGSEPGTPAQFKVSFPSTYTSSAATTVSYTVNGTAIAGTDYTALTGTVIIPANSNSAVINVPVLDDQVIEPNETVSLTLTGATNVNSAMAISPNGSAVTANIADNDNNTTNNNISLHLIRNGVEGGNNPQFEVSFPAGYSSSVPTVITYGITGINTAVLNVDYTVPVTTVTIPAYANSALIEIPLTNDLILEATESFQLVLTGATNSVAAGLTYQTSPVSADIADDDNIAANNVISLTKVSDGTEAGTPAVFNVSFPAGYINSVATTVNYVVSGGTALSGTDYTVIGQVTIPAGSGSANFDVTLLDDQILEDTETVQLTLVDATNSIFSPITVNLAPATANILDDDSAVATNKLITITPDDGAEVTVPGVQNPASFSFRFPSGITSSAPTVISYVLTGTAGGNGTDYTGAVSGTVTIPAGDNSVSINFPVSDDDIVENSETIILTTGVVSNIHVSGISVDNSPATLNITDNDAATLTVDNVTVTEGNSGDTEVEFTVTLDKATGGSFSLDYTTGNLSAETTDNDYNAKSETLSFAGNAGETVKFIIHVKGDKKIEGDEIFNVNFAAPDNTFGGRLTMPVPTATGTIENDDSGAISISSNPGSEANPNPNGTSFTFSFPPGVSSDQPTTIFFGLSVGSTATITDDYIFPALTGSVTIPPGVNSQTVTLPVVDDAILENTETITLTVGSVVNPYGITVTNPTVSTTIIDNDAASVSLSTPLTVNESAGTATFTVTLTGDVQEAFTVNYNTSDGTAIAPDDYTTTTVGTVSFPAGSVSGAIQTFTVAINDDNLVEPGETFRATLTGITGLTTIGTATAATTITDNDAASVAISTAATIDEDAGTATFTVTLTGNVQEAFAVNYATGNGTATQPGDYTTASGTLNFPAGSVSGTARTFTVPVVDDNLLEGDETFSATLSGITGGLVTIAIPTATTTIRDDDAAGVSISTPATVNEATGQATFTVTLTGNVQGSFTVDYATSAGTATQTTDYTHTTGSVTFPVGSVSGATRIFTVPLVNDGVTEPGETFSATLSNITGGLATIATTTATTTITDSDAAGISISAPATVNENAGTATFTVTLTGNVQDAFTVSYATSNLTTQAGDYANTTGTVTFPAGSVSGDTQPFTVNIVNDNFAEPGETFSVTLSNITSTLVTMGTATASVTINDDDVAGVALSTNPTVNENAGTTTFTVTLTGNVQNSFTVDYATSNGTAIAPGDYTAITTGTVTFPAGSVDGATQTFTVAILDDNLREPGETFSAALSNITGGLATIAAATATTTITDNDAASVVISTDPTVNENGTATFTVTLTGNVQQAFAVNYTTANGTALQPDDYTNTAGTLTFPAGSVSGDTRTFPVPIFNDQLAEGNETFSATLSGITGGLVTISTATATAIITDNDVASVAISTAAAVNESAGTATFTVTLTGGVQGAVTVDYATSDGSAKAPGDYTAATGTLTFLAGSVSGTVQTFTVPIQNDLFREGDETFSAALNNITGLATINTATATTTITDNDVASVAISTAAAVSESAGTATFTVTLTGNVQEPFTVSYSTTDGSATAPGDYTAATTGIVSFPAGSVSGTTQTFLVTINNDNLVETGETFSATLNSITGLTTITVAGATASTTIIDNDAATVAISALSPVNEASGTATFTVTLTGEVQQAFTVNYATSNGTASAPGDYIANTTGSVTFPANSQSGATQTFTVTVVNDNVVESDETFSVSLTGITGLTTIGTASATTTIIDNDAAGVSISAPATVSEATGIATFTVTLTGNVQESFTVNYATTDGGAIAPGDYANTTGSVIFPAGSVSGATKTFTVVIQNDNLTEMDETFSATLTGITGLTTISTATATATITDNDVASVSISVPATVNENGVTATFTVTLTGDVQEAVTVNYATANDSASAPGDYLARTGAVTFPAGSVNGAVKTFTVDLADDTFAEPNEMFSASLTGVTGLATISATATASTTIIDNDAASVSISTDPTVNESAGTATFTVTLTGGVQDAVTVDYSTSNGTAIAPGDYTATTGTVSFPSGSVSGATRTFMVPIQDDNLREPGEMFSAALSNITGLATIATATATTTITDNDVASVAISTSPTVNEAAGTATFTVTLTGNVSQAFTVNYATANGTAIQPNDYTQTGGIINFAANSASGATQTFTVPIFNDQLAESAETFRADLSGITGGLVTIGTATASTTITDDDAATVSISVPATVNENGNTVTFMATLNGGIQDAFTVNYSTSDGSAKAPGDYTAITNGTLTFPANSVNGTIRTFTVTIQDDQFREANEVFSANLSGITGLATIATATAATTIIDNDAASVSLSTPLTVNEGAGTATFTVTLTGDVQEAFTVTYSTSDGTAIAPDDYTAVPIGTVSFPAGSVSGATQVFTVAIQDDNLIEPGEIFSASLTSITGLTTIGTSAATTTINDNDAASVAISAPTTVDEAAGTATFTVTLTGDVQQAFAVNYTTSGLTAQAPEDYTHTTGTLNFPAGSVSGTTLTFAVPILDDNIVESGETFSVTLSGITGLTTIGTASATTTIIDNDAAGVSISAPATVSEATGIATFTVTLTGNVQESFTVNYATTDGGAIAPGDYATTTGTITFPAGSVSGATKIIQVPLVNDGIAEPGETFSTTLTGITGLTTISTATATTTITDSDAAGVSLSAPATVNETDGTATFTVTLTGDVQDAFTVNYATSNGTASASADYLTRVGSVTFPAGSVSGAVQTFRVDIVNDNFAEPGETFSATLSNITSTLVTMGTATASTTINDDDMAGVSISTNPTVNESAGTATFKVTLTGGVQDAVTVDYATSNGTAIAPGDYTATTGTVSFPSGSVSGATRTFTVPVQDDNLREPGEMFSAALSNITGLATIATATATTTITDNDVASVAISTNPTVNETAGTATFTVTLTGNVQQAFSVNYATANGSAIQPTDYTSTPGSITFPAGSVNGDTKTFTVPIFNDQLAEPAETFSAALSGISGLTTISTASAATTIIDNDVASVSISTFPTVNEAAGTATFMVTLSGGVQDAFAVNYATSNGSAQEPDDYTHTPGTLNFPAGSVNGTVRSFTVPILNDQFRERDETFSATLSNIIGGLATIATGTATTTIIDNDAASVSLSTPLTVNEGAGTATFTVTLTGNVQEDFTVSYATANGSAQAPNDYTTTAAGTISFPAGSVSGATQVFTVAIQDDNLVEPGEMFSASLTGITGLATISSTTASATTTIIDNDAASVAISTPLTINEAAGAATFTVTLTGDVQQAFAVNYTTSGLTAQAPGDYTHTTGTVNFPAGSVSGTTLTFAVPILDDNIVESGETFSVTLSGITGLTTIGTASATTTIIDNDAAGVSISAPATVSEATGIATFTVTLTGNVQESFKVNYATTDGGAIAPGDYANTTGSVIFPAGSVSGVTKTFTVVIQNDNLTEMDETFSATLTGITGLTTISTATATATIMDNDVAELSITDVTMIEGDGGTTDMSFTVKLNNATAKPFKVGYTTADGTATIADNDYEAALTGATVNYNGIANETQTITVKIYGNKKIEADENFKVILGAVSETFNGRLTVNSMQSTATGTIANDDSGEITITKVNGDEQGPVAGNFIFSFPSGVTSEQPVTINYTLGGSATGTAPNPDYTGTLTGTVTIAAGDGSAILNLPVNDDEIVEDDETVTIDASVSSIYGGVTLNASRPVVTIKDNDVAKLTLSGPVTLLETNTGTTTATFIVTLDKRTTGSFDLKYATADGTAKAGDNDYISNLGILHFAGNAGASYPITIQINGDRKIEQEEIFSLVLSNLSQTFNNRLTIPVTSTTITIENDDSGMIIIVPADGSEDGTPGVSPASFTFRFNDPDMTTDVPVTISYGLSGTALSTGTDYDYTASPAIGSITLPANAKSVKLNLDVNDDQVVERTETVILATNTGGLPYGITVSNSPQSLNIADNDGAKLTISNATVTEGDSGTQDITFTVKLDKATGEPFTVTYATADGTATDGTDYVGRTGVLNFNGTANEIQTITIQVKGDQRLEQNETFTVTLGTLSNLNDILSIPSPQATGTIIDDDNTQIILSKVADGEEPLTNARFKVNFIKTSVTSSEATQVSYNIAGTATNGIDYIALNGNVVIPAGSNEAFIDVEVTDDQLIEPTETLILTLTAASSGSFTLPVQVTPVSANIKDNDQVALTVSNPVVTEGNNGTVTATFNVILSTGTPNGFMVSYNTTDGTATVADNDYTAVNGTLNFNGTAGETHSISVTVKGDQKIERDETFNMMLNLSDTFGGRLNLIGSPAAGTILDDDNVPANKKITITTTDGMEGLYNGSFTFSFPTGITTDAPTTIPFILGGTAFKNQDYIAMFSSPIVIPAGVSSLTLPVPVIDDDIMEGTETLQMITGGVGNSRYNGITVNTPVPVLNIFDNDNSQLTISSPTIKEGNSGGTLLTFEVKLNGATGAGFTVDYTTEDGTATLNDHDYNFVKGTLVFNGTVEGEAKTISVWINGDINIEDNENFRVVLSGLSKTFGGALKISDWPGVGTILNDDIQPVASDDIIMTDEDTPVTFSITGNDTDADGTVNPESIVVVTSTVHGTLLFNPDGTFTYTPEDNYYGKDEFTYKVSDNTGIESNVAKVSIVINAVNDAPVARDDIFYVRKDGSLNATVKTNDTDLDGDYLSFKVLTSPANGRLTSFNPADGSFVYVPRNGFVGIDHFSYRACDAPGLCSTAQVTLYVQPKVTVKLTPSAATITEGDLISITAEIGESLFQDVEIILSYTGSALLEKDYILEGDYISMVIPAGKLATTQKFTIRSIKDFLKEGDEVVQVRVQSVNPSDFVDKGLGSDILIKDFYPEDKGTDENANGDINPDPLASPNGDGLGNENFIIHNIERYPDNEVLIFNRWGNKVFQVKGYNNRDKAFSGVANTGLLVNKNSVLVDGVYFYIIHTKDSTGALRINKGTVIIKR
jgi:hypothetical protein